MPLAPAPSTPSARALAGGPATRSPVIYAVLVALAAVVMLEVLRAGDLSASAGVLALVAASGLVLAAKAVIDRTVLRSCDRAPVPVWGTVATGGVLGAVMAVPFALAMGWWSGDGPDVVVPIVVAFIARSALIFALLAYVLGLRRWYRTERRQAERALVEAESRRMLAGDALESTRAVMLEAVRREIAPAQREASDLLDVAARSEEPADLARAAESLRLAARSSVRSASHDLWTAEGDSATAIRWRSIVPDALVRYPLPMLLACVLLVGAILTRGEVLRNPPKAASLFVAVAVVAVSYLAGRAIIGRWRRLAIPVTAAAIIAATLGALYGGLGVVGHEVVPVLIASGVVVIGAVTVGSSVVQMITASGAAAIQSLVDDRAREDARKSALEAMTASLSRDLAAHLHGTVQPQLVAASVALEAATDSGDPTAIADAVAQADRALAMGIGAPDPVDERTLAHVLGGLGDRWRGMLDLDVTVDGDPGDRRADAVARVVDECLNNALVHGGATRAWISVECSDDHWQVHVRDNGAGPAGGVPGLGSAVLDQVTGGRWEMRAADAGGTQVRAHIPGEVTAPRA